MDKANIDSDGYQVVRGFLDPTLCKLLTHTVMLMRLNLEQKDVFASTSHQWYVPEGFAHRDRQWDGFLPGEDQQVLKSYAWYGHPLMDSMLALSGSFIGQLIDKQLFPTFSYCRSYQHGATLPEHTDRVECQYSATLALGGDPWPIFMGGTQIDLARGDMVVYAGHELPHSRNEFEGNECTQLFLHYGDTSNPIAEMFDGRLTLGVPSYVNTATLRERQQADQQSINRLRVALERTEYSGKED